ncbi:MAG: TIGR04283 family arsenosugar biosynthesis glycosyltransferase [Chthoniobacterales bacterium]|nr:TIGR04283 family arsenosugar biosynthesis glycosyltransferase [Chthoniobacterales bacterium]
MNSRPEISVIIPTANEAAALPLCLARIGGAPNEIIVVDAQSEDETASVARRFGCTLLSLPQRHRARQMNFGAAQARGRILLFLHADTLLPAGALAKIAGQSERFGAAGGGFARRYRSRSLTLALTCRLSGLRNRLLGWHLGDQAIFVRRDVFAHLGGFRDLPIFEDLDFSRRLRAVGRTITLSPPVLSSARRFAAKGPLRTTLDDLALTGRYLAGADPNELCNARGIRVEKGQPKNYEHIS